MAFDGIVMASIKDELAKNLTGGRIEKIYQPEKDEVVLLIHNLGKKSRLLISANSQNARIHVTSVVKENPMTPPMFCMVLRKHMEGSRIIAIQQLGLERVLHIVVSSIDELGEPSEKTLIVEIMGKHSNIVLVESATGTILDGIKRYSHALSRHREILPGRSYIAPPEQNKLNPLELSENNFNDRIINSNLESKVTNSILINFEGISPLISREILSLAALPEDLRLQDCGEHEVHRLWQSFSSIIAVLKLSSFLPSVYFDNHRPLAFSAINLTQYDGLQASNGSMSEVIDVYFSNRESSNRVQQQQNDLLKRVNDELERNLKRINIQEEAIADAEKAEEYKIYGELLTANLYQIQQGQDYTEVVNYYDPEGNMVKIPLDRQLSPSGNAQDYYKKYDKAKSTTKSAQKQKAIAQEEVDYLESVKQSILQATTVEEIREIREELVEEAYIKEKQIKNNKNKKAEKVQLKPLSYVSADGLEILVGKNNRQNDLLTMKLAKDNDTWLHVKNIPGSHVIIKNNGHSLPKKTLLQGAMLAAYYSKASESSNVPVDYTERKFVHKPRGAKPGMVIYTDQKTVVVTPDKDVIGEMEKS